MNTQPRRVAAWVWLWALVICVPAHAVGSLNRCQTRDGQPVYTDTACAALDAMPAPISAELVNRLTFDASASASAGLLGTRHQGAIPLRRPAASGCARNVGQLSLDLLGAFAAGDVNRIAESFHWPGLQHQQAHLVMQRLQRLSRQSLVDASYWPGLASASSSASSNYTGGADHGGDGGAMQLIFSEPQQVLELGVQRYSGCYFVRF
ncbi:hypothetical protein MNR01_07550 [Lysobacter sp. S4-A87]|uniref:hypothetical protein n=1 Tax=Lysobacter sp. S4-A87 TaxID=2925843 RepID=UPI001F5358F0|nr:hypothetical protein [Lysobacter sp. S4-A87]UNK50845.1 hypothetical protein MNR01_07550 [Lysobacter sp. S4-A87]